MAKKVGLFIDGSNLFATAKTLGFDLDFGKLPGVFGTPDEVLRCYYYTAVVENQEYQQLQPLLDWLDFNGYLTVTKPTKEFIDPVTGRKKIKGNMDVEMAVDCMVMSKHLTHIVLITGDGDFTYLVEMLQREGVHVSIVSTIQTNPPMVADELRRIADRFVDLGNIRDKVQRITPRSPR